MDEFHQWKELQEESTYTTYVQQQASVQPKTCEGILYLQLYSKPISLSLLVIKATHYYSCCRDGNYRGNASKRKSCKKRPHQKPSRKLNAVCISRMYVNEYYSGHVEVTYITAHTNHELGATELPHLPLPASVKKDVALKVSQGVPSDIIQDGNVCDN